MRILVLRERDEGETRVALVPAEVKRLAARGPCIAIEPGAGAAAGFPDEAYAEAGAEKGEVADADLVVAVNPPPPELVGSLRRGAILVSFLDPLRNAALVRAMADAGVTAFALDAVPRISRAQSMDALSAMSNLAGYRAAILAAHASGRFFPLLMTAAGTLPPARVLVIGAGVAGLQAIATARRLGAEVEAFDTRPAVKEEVLSLGARFVEIGVAAGSDASGYAEALAEAAERREREGLARHVAAADAVITTALVPGRPAPRILTEEMVRAMRPGSVIVDLAAPAGGNCELTRPGETAREGGVSLLGPLNLPAEMPEPASRMLSRVVGAFLDLLLPEGEPKLDFDDEILRGCCVTHRGEVRHAGAREALERRT